MSRLPVAILGDFHAPYHCRRSVARAVAIIEKLRPKVIVQIGDAYDLYSFSRFPRSHDVTTPGFEMRMGRKALEGLFANLRKASPQAEIFLLRGNHDSRLARRMMAALPEFESFLKNVDNDLWKFDGVTTMAAERDELILDGVCYMHGYRRHGDHVRYNLMSTVCGHSHTGGVIFVPHKGQILFELNAGYLGDPKSKALSYTAQSKISKWTKGMGVIDANGPRFIPF